MAKRQPIEIEETTEQLDEFEFINALAADVNSSLKRDAIMVGGSGGDTGVPYWVRTGIPQLDFAVGGFAHPGFPGSRIIEIFGGEASGKSTLAVWLTKMAMEQVGAIPYYQDAEMVLTPEILQGTGIDERKLLREQPQTLEEVFDAQEAILNAISGKFKNKPVAIVLDSIAACSTKAEIEGDMEAVQMGIHARLMSKGLRKILGQLTNTSVLSIWVNQIREKMGGVAWGDNTATFGGKAMAFYASVRIKVGKIGTLKDKNGKPNGCTIKAKIAKNKVAPPLQEVEYEILFIQDENGSYPRLNIEGAILDWCKGNGLIGGGTGFYEVGGRKMRKNEAQQAMIDDPKLFKELYDLAYSMANTTETEE